MLAFIGPLGSLDSPLGLFLTQQAEGVFQDRSDLAAHLLKVLPAHAEARPCVCGLPSPFTSQLHLPLLSPILQPQACWPFLQHTRVVPASTVPSLGHSPHTDTLAQARALYDEASPCAYPVFHILSLYFPVFHSTHHFLTHYITDSRITVMPVYSAKGRDLCLSHLLMRPKHLERHI